MGATTVDVQEGQNVLIDRKHDSMLGDGTQDQSYPPAEELPYEDLFHSTGTFLITIVTVSKFLWDPVNPLPISVLCRRWVILNHKTKEEKVRGRWPSRLTKFSITISTVHVMVRWRKLYTGNVRSAFCILFLDHTCTEPIQSGPPGHRCKICPHIWPLLVHLSTGVQLWLQAPHSSITKPKYNLSIQPSWIQKNFIELTFLQLWD